MKKFIVPVIFLTLTILAACFINKVNVNYNLVNYLESDSELKQGIDIYQDEFGTTSQAVFCFDEDSITDALTLKSEINQMENVKAVVYLDDHFNAITYELVKANLSPETVPLLDAAVTNYLMLGYSYPEIFIALMPYFPTDVKVEFQETIDSYMSEEGMLFQVVFESDASDLATETTINQIKDLLEEDGYEYHFSGSAVSTIFTKNIIESEIFWITIICVPILLVVLSIFNRSYFDLILFGIVVGVSIVINLGTNAILPDISFITSSMAIVLQLAISLDYVIFMINAYHQERKEGKDVNEAIRCAKKNSFKPIIASALTTGVSFLALSFMRFTIGFDIGIVFAKAIVISLLSTIILLPSLIKIFAKAIDKTTKERRSLFSGNLTKRLYKFRYAFLALLLVVLSFSAYIQSQNEYTYGSSSFAGTEGSEYYEDTRYIEESFGTNNMMLIIIPTDDSDELALYQSLVALDYIDDLQAGIYYKTFITDELILAMVTNSLYSENYALFNMNLLGEIEGDEAFSRYEEIETIITDLEIDDAYILGETSIAYNIRDTVKFDYNLVLVIALVAVMIIIMITFKNLLMPILLPLTIVTSVFFTMAVLHFINNEMVFLANLIVSAILLGVTIDYAILLGKTYMEARTETDKTESLRIAMKKSAPSVITSAMLFSIAGFTITAISSIQTVAQIGLIIAVGAIVSLFYVLIILPQILSIFDKWICKSKIELK